MAVNATHPGYDAALPTWTRARDVLAGEDAVKAAGERYLPRLDSQSDEEYAAYKARASFFGATARTVEEYLELVFRKAPVLNLGESKMGTRGRSSLREFVADCDLWGLEFLRYARRVVAEVLSVGRAGSLVLREQSGRPVVSLWRAEEILNWKVERSGGRVVLTGLTLRDGERVRVLRLHGTDGTNGTDASGCVMEVWERGKDEKDRSDQKEWALVSSEVLTRDGKALGFIPFVFHGPRDSRPEPGGLPLAELIASNLDHYRLDADYKHGLHFAALPTAWVSGFDKSAPLRIGSSTAWVSDVPGASAGYLEYSARGLAYLERAIEKVERRMASFGAGMLEGGGDGGQLCGLGSIVASLNESLTRVLRIAQWWIEGGELDAQTASIAMDTDLSARVVSGDLISAVVGAWRAGGISRDTMLNWLKRWEVLPEGRTVADERALIHGKVGVQR